jgi:anaerobic selenocysteine-containing dehydrogenase
VPEDLHTARVQHRVRARRSAGPSSGIYPSVSRLAHATATVDAVNRGARLVVVDPRRVGLASRADHWLGVRPGAGAALALGLVHIMLERCWYDRHFVSRWTNPPLLVRSDTGGLLRADQLANSGSSPDYVAWSAVARGPVTYTLQRRTYPVPNSNLALSGTLDLATRDGVVACRPVLEALRLHCLPMAPEATEAITGVSADELERIAETVELAASRVLQLEWARAALPNTRR